MSVDKWGPEKAPSLVTPRTRTRAFLVIDNTARGPGKGG